MHVAFHNNTRKAAFTLAEVLITLAIIGVVAALTMPRFISDMNEKQYNSGRVKALSLIGEAGKRIASAGEMNSSYNAQEFIDNTLKKYLKIVKSCVPGKFTDCGWSNEVESLHGNKIRLQATLAATTGACSGNNLQGTCGSTSYFRAFTLANGYAFILYYNPYCAPVKYTGDFQIPANKICMHLLYDMNGLKGPNRYGKDIGHITVFNGDETTYTVAPFVDSITSSGTLAEAVSFCLSRGKDYYLPSIDELLSISFSTKFHDYTSGYFKSSTKVLSNSHSILDMSVSRAYRDVRCNIVCVKH